MMKKMTYQIPQTEIVYANPDYLLDGNGPSLSGYTEGGDHFEFGGDGNDDDDPDAKGIGLWDDIGWNE